MAHDLVVVAMVVFEQFLTPVNVWHTTDRASLSPHRGQPRGHTLHRTWRMVWV